MDKYEKTIEACKRADSRIPASGLLGMNINSYIASITDLNNTPLSQEDGISQKSKKKLGIMVYLRDHTGAQTVGQVMQAIQQRKIDPKIVKLWVDEELCVDPLEYEAVKTGYPEYSSELKEIRDRVFGNLFDELKEKLSHLDF